MPSSGSCTPLPVLLNLHHNPSTEQAWRLRGANKIKKKPLPLCYLAGFMVDQCFMESRVGWGFREPSNNHAGQQPAGAGTELPSVGLEQWHSLSKVGTCHKAQ